MASDIFIKLDGIDGESSDVKHKGEIEILSYSWGLTNSGAGVLGGLGAGRVTFSDFSFMARQQKSSPSLFLKCASGQHIKQGVISVRTADENAREFHKITLTDILVSSFQTSHSEGGDDKPVESLSLNFTKIKYEYTLADGEGTPGTTFAAEWDLKKAKGN